MERKVIKLSDMKKKKLNSLTKDEIGQLGSLYAQQKKNVIDATGFMRLNELEMRATKEQRARAYKIAGFDKMQTDIILENVQ